MEDCFGTAAGSLSYGSQALFSDYDSAEASPMLSDSAQNGQIDNQEIKVELPTDFSLDEEEMNEDNEPQEEVFDGHEDFDDEHCCNDDEREVAEETSELCYVDIEPVNDEYPLDDQEEPDIKDEYPDDSETVIKSELFEDYNENDIDEGENGDLANMLDPSNTTKMQIQDGLVIVDPIKVEDIKEEVEEEQVFDDGFPDSHLVKVEMAEEVESEEEIPVVKKKKPSKKVKKPAKSKSAKPKKPPAKRQTDPSKKLTCSQCDYRTNKACDLKRHTFSRHEKVRHKCGECNFSATSQQYLRRHRAQGGGSILDEDDVDFR